MYPDLEGKSVLVTGGGTGIGAAAVRAFAREGCRVLAVGRHAKTVEDVVGQVKAEGGVAEAHTADIADAADVENMVTTAVALFGTLDIAFNNAGVVQASKPVHELTEAEFDAVVSVNLRGTWLCMKYEIQHMLTNGSGVIVNTASTASHHGVPGMASYNASKHGLLGLTRAAALEVIRSGIRVNCLTPGLIETPILGDFLNRSGDTGALDAIRAGIPLGRTGRPEEAAAAALWLASDQSSFVYGHSLIAAGGELV